MELKNIKIVISKLIVVAKRNFAFFSRAVALPLLSTFLPFYLSTCLYGSVDIMSGFGSPVRGISARSLALGGCGIVLPSDISTTLSNPGFVYSEKRVLILTPDLLWSSEKREHLYLSTKYARNSGMYFKVVSAGILMPISLKRNITFSFAYSNEYDFNFKYEEESERIRDATGLKRNGKDVLKYTGGLDSLGFVLSFKPAKSVGVGAGLYVLVGSNNRTEELNNYATQGLPSTSLKTKSNSKLTGIRPQVGFGYIIKARTSIGIVWKCGFQLESSTKLENYSDITLTSSETYKSKYNYPQTFGLGFSYAFGDEHQTSVFVDLLYSDFSKSRRWLYEKNRIKVTRADGGSLFVIAGTTTTIRDAFEFHIGFEHTPKRNLTLRYGFSLLQDYLKIGGLKPAVSVGAGLKISVVKFDIAGEYSWNKSTQSRLYQLPETEQTKKMETDTIHYSSKRLILTVSYEF